MKPQAGQPIIQEHPHAHKLEAALIFNADNDKNTYTYVRNTRDEFVNGIIRNPGYVSSDHTNQQYIWLPELGSKLKVTMSAVCKVRLKDTQDNCLIWAAWTNNPGHRISVHMPYGAIIYFDYGNQLAGGRLSASTSLFVGYDQGWRNWCFTADSNRMALHYEKTTNALSKTDNTAYYNPTTVDGMSIFGQRMSSDGALGLFNSFDLEYIFFYSRYLDSRPYLDIIADPYGMWSRSKIAIVSEPPIIIEDGLMSSSSSQIGQGAIVSSGVVDPALTAHYSSQIGQGAIVSSGVVDPALTVHSSDQLGNGLIFSEGYHDDGLVGHSSQQIGDGRLVLHGYAEDGLTPSASNLEGQGLVFSFGIAEDGQANSYFYQFGIGIVAIEGIAYDGLCNSNSVQLGNAVLVSSGQAEGLKVSTSSQLGQARISSSGQAEGLIISLSNQLGQGFLVSQGIFEQGLTLSLSSQYGSGVLISQGIINDSLIKSLSALIGQGVIESLGASEDGLKRSQSLQIGEGFITGVGIAPDGLMQSMTSFLADADVAYSLMDSRSQQVGSGIVYRRITNPRLLGTTPQRRLRKV